MMWARLIPAKTAAHFPEWHNKNPYHSFGMIRIFLEAPPGFEPGDKGFADLCLTSWLWRRFPYTKYMVSKTASCHFHKKMERVTRLEFALTPHKSCGFCGDPVTSGFKNGGGSELGKALWSGLRGSNSLPPPWQGGALPNELNPQMPLLSGVVPSVGIEPTTRGFSVLCSTN